MNSAAADLPVDLTIYNWRFTYAVPPSRQPDAGTLGGTGLTSFASYLRKLRQLSPDCCIMG